MTLDHKTTKKNKGQFFNIEIDTSAGSWINTLSVDVWFVRIWQYLAEIQLFENIRVQKKNLKIAFIIVQIRFLAMHITNQKSLFYIFTVGHFQNIFMEHNLYLIS